MQKHPKTTRRLARIQELWRIVDIKIWIETGRPKENFLKLHRPTFKSQFLCLGYLQEVYKILDFEGILLHNLHRQVLTHCLTVFVSLSMELICLMCSGRSDQDCRVRQLYVSKPKCTTLFLSVSKYWKVLGS